MHHKDPTINKADLCASFEQTITETLMEHVEQAMIEHDIKVVTLAGGVSANSYIRNEFSKLEQKRKITVYYPELTLCTDNAAMIASAGYYNYLAGKRSDLTLNAIPNLKIGENR